MYVLTKGTTSQKWMITMIITRTRKLLIMIIPRHKWWLEMIKKNTYTRGFWSLPPNSPTIDPKVHSAAPWKSCHKISAVTNKGRYTSKTRPKYKNTTVTIQLLNKQNVLSLTVSKFVNDKRNDNSIDIRFKLLITKWDQSY